jgi:hypothetical protein
LGVSVSFAGGEAALGDLEDPGVAAGELAHGGGLKELDTRRRRLCRGPGGRGCERASGTGTRTARDASKTFGVRRLAAAFPKHAPSPKRQSAKRRRRIKRPWPTVVFLSEAKDLIP